MKKILLAIFMMAGTFTYAQTQQDVALIQNRFGKEKLELVKSYMTLNDEQSAKFWPIYNAYEQERQALMRERYQAIVDYAQKYSELNDESANKIMESVLNSDVKLVKLEKSYLGKMKKAVGGVTATKFFVLETYLRNVIFAEIQEQITSISDLQK